MATLRDIRRRVVSVKSTAKITSAMKMVSAAKLRRGQEAIESSRPYVFKLGQSISNLVESVGENFNDPIIEVRSEVKNIALIVIGSDRGLCGSFNTNLFKAANVYIKEDLANQFPNANVSIVAVGKKAVSFFSKEKNPVIAKYPGIFTNLNFNSAKEIIDSVKAQFLNGEFDKVIVFYNEFKSLIKQIPTVEQLLPIQAKANPNAKTDKFKEDYIYEPNQFDILSVLLPKYVDILFWKALLESNAAEYAARMMAMENATRNAKDLITALNLIYNRERQAAITREMLEIVGGAEALSK